MSDEQEDRDDVVEAITEVAESLGMTVGPVIVPTPEMRQAAADRLELAEVAICEASGDVPQAIVEFDPMSRQNGNRWSDRQDDPLWLLTPAELEMVPDGTVLVCISGERVVKGVDEIDDDTRGGYIAYGLLGSQLAPVEASR